MATTNGSGLRRVSKRNEQSTRKHGGTPSETEALGGRTIATAPSRALASVKPKKKKNARGAAGTPAKKNANEGRSAPANRGGARPRSQGNARGAR